MRQRERDVGAGGSFGPAGVDASEGDGPLSADPRDRAIRRLARQARHFPDLRIGSVDVAGLEPRDAGLARVIEELAIRRWITLEWVLRAVGGREPGEMEPKMRAVLLAGAVQVLLLDRVPDHAAIDRSVEWAKTNIRPGAGGMVNAVLRKVAGVRGERREAWTLRRDELPLEEGGALGLAADLLPEGDIERLGVGVGLHPGLVGRWAGAHGASRARELAAHSLIRAPTLLNVAHAAGPLEGDGLIEPGDLLPHRCPGHRVYAGPRDRLERLLSARQDVWAQDPASSGAVESAAGLCPGMVVDACAGRGTKTRQLAAAFPAARVIATDTDAERFAELRRVFEGSERVEVVPPRRLREVVDGGADLVLLDVPCSNTGVLSRRPEARHRVDRAALERLAGIQRQIIADAIPLLAPGGSLLYATCSVEREENEDQAAWAGRWHGLRPHRERRCWPTGRPGGDPAAHQDGAYSVLLRP